MTRATQAKAFPTRRLGPAEQGWQDCCHRQHIRACDAAMGKTLKSEYRKISENIMHENIRNIKKIPIKK